MNASGGIINSHGDTVNALGQRTNVNRAWGNPASPAFILVSIFVTWRQGWFWHQSYSKQKLLMLIKTIIFTCLSSGLFGMGNADSGDYRDLVIKDLGQLRGTTRQIIEEICSIASKQGADAQGFAEVKFLGEFKDHDSVTWVKFNKDQAITFRQAIKLAVFVGGFSSLWVNDTLYIASHSRSSSVILLTKETLKGFDLDGTPASVTPKVLHAKLSTFGINIHEEEIGISHDKSKVVFHCDEIAKMQINSLVIHFASIHQ